MKYILVISILSILIPNISVEEHNRQQHNKIHKKQPNHHAPKLSQSGISKFHPSLQTTTIAPIASPLEIDTLKCPLGCVCQYAHFKDLPISRWINYMQMRQPGRGVEETNDNDELYDADETFLENPFVKQATCILQEDTDPDALVNSLPHDLQALVLLYTGIGKNKTVNTSVLKPLNQLNTLEIRGAQDRTFRFVFDEPLSFLQYVNFESITLLGSDTFKRPQNPVHPSESFDYKPRIELYESFETQTTGAADGNGKSNVNRDQKLGFEMLEDEIEILPYDVYMMEVKKARMPTFYGWEHLEVLRIHGCELNELHWEMFDGLEALEHLSLERNEIEMVPAFALYGVMHIKTLSLAHNHIHDLHYRSLAGLLELEMLDLSDNRLNKLSELSFPPFPKLERVVFRNNPIRYIFPASFWIMNGTRSMLFDSNEVSMELWGNQPFESLVELKELTIGNVSIGSLEPNIFKGLTSLEKLKLKGEIRSIEFDAFAGLVELKELDLSDCKIREISMDAFMGCKNLLVLNLARNNITYIPPGLFDDQHMLEEIYLDGNQLRSLPTTFFLQPKLRLARLSDNPWKCSCDMSNWRPKITNQERGPRTERCITDFQTGKRIACRTVDNFKFDHRYAPRCANYNGRSVFYVLRKQLQCGPGRMVRIRVKQRHPEENGIYSGTVAKKHEYNASHKQKAAQQKSQHAITLQRQKQNSLRHVLYQQQQKEHQVKLQKQLKDDTTDDDDIPNDIY